MTLMENQAEAIEALVQTDANGYGVIRPLRDATRLKQGEAGCLRAARLLSGRLGSGDWALLCTGYILPGFAPYGETDGPLGAAALARALSIGLGARPLVLVEESLAEMQQAVCRAAGLNVVPVEALAEADPGRNRAVAVGTFPLEPAEALEEARRLVGGLQPKAVLAIEKNGPNEKGVYHMVSGTDGSALVAKSATLFDEARRRGVLTIGIGDRGNEIGFGMIRETVRSLLPFGAVCRCPCGAGVADATATDVLVTAAVSNWGAYGVAACLALLRGRDDLAHDAEMEHRMLAACIGAGGYDGMSGQPVPMVDGMPLETHRAVVSLLREIVRARAAREPTLFSTPLFPDAGSHGAG